MYQTNSEIIIYICAGLLMSGGLIFGIATTCCLVRMSYYFFISDAGMEFGGAVLFICASALCIPTSWIVSMLPVHPRNVSVAGSLIALISVSILLMISGLSTSSGISYIIRDAKVMNNSMHRGMAMLKYESNIRNAFDTMQLDLKCCGIQSHNDWYEHMNELPASCCGRLSMNTGSSCVNPKYKQGCLYASVNQLRAYLGSVGVLAYAMVLVLTISLLVTAYTLVTTSVIDPPPFNQLSAISVTSQPPIVRSPVYQT